MKRHRLNPVASVTLSRMVDDLEGMVNFLAGMGFQRVTFSYPVTRLQSSYLGFAEHYSVDFSPEELHRWFGRIKDLKARSPLDILNPKLGLTDLQRQLEQRPGRLSLSGGLQIFFCGLGPQCFPLPIPVGDPGPPGGDSPFRPHPGRLSGLHHRLLPGPERLSVPGGVGGRWPGGLRQGQWLKGLGALLHPYNFLSLAALLEGRHWVRG